MAARDVVTAAAIQLMMMADKGRDEGVLVATVAVSVNATDGEVRRRFPRKKCVASHRPVGCFLSSLSSFSRSRRAIKYREGFCLGVVIFVSCSRSTKNSQTFVLTFSFFSFFFQSTNDTRCLRFLVTGVDRSLQCEQPDGANVQRGFARRRSARAYLRQVGCALAKYRTGHTHTHIYIYTENSDSSDNRCPHRTPPSPM